MTWTLRWGRVSHRCGYAWHCVAASENAAIAKDIAEKATQFT